MELTYKIVRRLLRDHDVGFSRNKNFDAYDDPIVRQALRIYKHLRSVELDILAVDGDTVCVESVERIDDRVVIRLSYPRRRGSRESHLTEQEWNLLVESEQVKDILDQNLPTECGTGT